MEQRTVPTFQANAPSGVLLDLPQWSLGYFNSHSSFDSDASKMSAAIYLSRLNVSHETGTPFAATIVNRADNKLVSIGVNSVLRLNNCALHGETMAIMMANAALESCSLKMENGPGYELFTSCEPCAMCLGAIFWSGVTRVVWAATRDDAERLGYDEGPVFAASHEYLRQRGITLEHMPSMRQTAVDVLQEYRASMGWALDGHLPGPPAAKPGSSRSNNEASKT